MTLGQAWQAAKLGKAIARRAWGKALPPLRITAYDAETPPGVGGRLNVAAKAEHLVQGDLDAEDWYVVPDA